MDRRTMMIGTTLAAAFAAARALPHGTDKSKLLNVLFDRLRRVDLALHRSACLLRVVAGNLLLLGTARDRCGERGFLGRPK
jgi:hypothetical protein